MADPPFLDTNVFLRHVRQDHPDHSPRATAYFARIEQGELIVRTAETVIFETVFTLQSLYQQPREAIRDTLLPLIDLPGVLLDGKARLHRAFALYMDRRLSFADCFHVALMEELGLTEIVSFDRGFDRVPGVRRVEP